MFKRLKMLNSVQEDMPQLVISIFKTCSVEPFQRLSSTQDDQMHISEKQMMPEEICSIAEQNYLSM
eukprot:8202052-Ditylum_brightwellii.AAC.1